MATREVVGHPAADGLAINAKGLGHIGGTLSSLNCLDCLHSHRLKGLVIVLATVIVSFAFHATDYNTNLALLL